MRKLASAVFAIPVLILVYLTLPFRRSVAARVLVLAGVGSLLTFGALQLAEPVETTAVPPTRDVPLTGALFQTRIEVDRAPTAPVQVTFMTAMVPESVAAALRIEPPTEVELDWDSSGTVLRIRPAVAWSPGTFHTVTVEPGALAHTGRPMSSPARAIFLTRPATTARLQAQNLIDGAAATGSWIELAFDREVEHAKIRAALIVDPPIEGRLIAIGREDEVGAASALAAEPDTDARAGIRTRFRFVPADGWTPGATYAFSLADGLTDADGAPVVVPEPLTVEVAAIPSVVRFRPRNDTTAVDRDSTLSVRFSEPMDRATAAAAWSVSAGGADVAGTVTWAESDSVLVFKPAAPLPYATKVEMRVGPDAQSRAGLPIEAVATGQFTTQAAPPPPPAPRPARTPAPTTSGGTGGGAVGAGTWAAVETYYLGLMNCTRTGGWVASNGSCSGAGSRNVAPLALDAGISDRVARPYAQLLATRNLCSHFIGGSPANRLRAAGFSSHKWAENLGCRSGDARAAVLGSHLFFQSERPYNGGHYRNIMDAGFDRVGIGVWVSGGRVRLVVNFYRP